MLAPRDTSSRERRRLDGLWSFAFDLDGSGRSAGWWRGPLPNARSMAVPSSYNDAGDRDREHEHVGDVWYQREFRSRRGWAGRGVVLRFDAATHRGTVWVGDDAASPTTRAATRPSRPTSRPSIAPGRAVPGHRLS